MRSVPSGRPLGPLFIAFHQKTRHLLGILDFPKGFASPVWHGDLLPLFTCCMLENLATRLGCQSLLFICTPFPFCTYQTKPFCISLRTEKFFPERRGSIGFLKSLLCAPSPYLLLKTRLKSVFG